MRYTRSVQRRLAKLLLLLISFGLIAPALPGMTSSGESKLPACCRKDGKHKCGMKSMSGGSALAGAGEIDHESQVRPEKASCPYCPEGRFSPARDVYAGSIAFTDSEDFRLAVADRLVAIADPISSIVRNSHSQRGPPAPVVVLVSTFL